MPEPSPNGTGRRRSQNGNGRRLATPILRTIAGRAAVLRADRRTRQEFAMLINGAWRKTIEGLLETGAYLDEANQELDPAEYRAMIAHDLLMPASTARKLRIIARDPVLSDRSHVNALPACFTTLYELSQLSERTKLALIETGEINSKMQRSEATALLPDRRHNRRQPLTVSPQIATLLRASVQVEELDACLSYLRNLQDPSDIRISPDVIDPAASWLKRKLANGNGADR